jgi:hypothetical protein
MQAPLGRRGDSMSSGTKHVFGCKQYLRAYLARKRTPKQTAVIALFRVVKDRLRTQLEYDGIDPDEYGLPDLEVIRIDADGHVHVAFSGVYSFGSTIEELMDDLEDQPEDAPSILSLLKRTYAAASSAPQKKASKATSRNRQLHRARTKR